MARKTTLEKYKEELKTLKRELKEAENYETKTWTDQHNLYEALKEKYTNELGDAAFKDVWWPDDFGSGGCYVRMFNDDVFNKGDYNKLKRLQNIFHKSLKPVEELKTKVAEQKAKIKKLEDKQKYGITPNQRKLYTELKQAAYQKKYLEKKHQEEIDRWDDHINTLLEKLKNVDLEALGGY